MEKYTINDACSEGNLSKVKELYKAPNPSDKIGWGCRTPVLCAIENGHLNIVQFLLERAGNINDTHNEQEKTALHIACDKVKVEIVQWLLENRANANLADTSDRMPIHLAMQKSYDSEAVKIIKLLLEHGADPTAVLPGSSPVSDAFKHGTIDLIKLFVEHKVDLYKSYLKDKFESLLMLALRRGNVELIEYLIELGVDFKDRYKTGFDCFAVCTDACNLEFLEFICKTVYKGEIADESKSRAIHTAAMECGEGTLEFLLDLGCSIEARNYYMETPLMSAIVNGNDDNVELLLRKGAEKEVTRLDGKAPLHLYGQYISDRGYFVNEFRDYGGPRFNATDADGRTPLHYAIMAGSPCAIRKLTCEGSKVDVADHNNKTVLHYLCGADELDWNQEFAEEVVKGNDIEATDEEGRTALHYAAENKSFILLTFLVLKGANISAVSRDKGTILHHALAKFRNYNVQLAIALGADVNIANKDGKTPLHYASYCKDILTKLVDKGADVRAVDNDGLTPLHYACQGEEDRTLSELCGRDEVLGCLIDRGADVNARDKLGRTPLHFAYKNENSVVIEFLLEHGADKNAVDNEGRNVLHYAAQARLFFEEDFSFDDRLNVPDKNGHRPMFYAGCTKVLKYLIDHTDNIKPDEFRNYFPHQPLDLEGLKIVFERGANVDAVDENGNTMLHKYLKDGDDEQSHEKVEFLLERGADVNARNKNLATPAHVAIAAGEKYVCLKFLADRGADMTAKDKDSKTPIDYARNGKFGLQYAQALNYLTI